MNLANSSEVGNAAWIKLRGYTHKASADLLPKRLNGRLLSMIRDKNLHLYNRLLMAYLFDNYNHHLQDEARKKNNAAGLLSAVATLPDGIGNSFAQ